jgi:hypothetical protein
MSHPILIGERVTRDGTRSVGELWLNFDTASQLASDGIGLFVEEADLREQIRIIPHLIRNARPWTTVVAAYSYESIDLLIERCREWDVKVHPVGYGQTTIPDCLECDAVISVPERLYLLHSLIRGKKLYPRIVVMMDPLGTSTAVREWNGRPTRRAENIGNLRSVAIAAGPVPLPIYLSGARAASMFMDNVQTCTGVESMQFLQAPSLRVADLVGTIEGVEVSNTEATHWLDGPVTKWGNTAQRGITLMVTGGHFIQREETLCEFASTCGHPAVSLRTIADSLCSTAVSLADVAEAVTALRNRIMLANKRVVILKDTAELYRGTRVALALGLLAVRCPGTIVLVAGPPQWDDQAHDQAPLSLEQDNIVKIEMPKQAREPAIIIVNAPRSHEVATGG